MLQSAKTSGYYIGQTDDVEKRLINTITLKIKTIPNATSPGF
ncbi:MAG: hypothetical protein ACK4GL_05215 [Flavobacteriales bacterium]